MGLEQDNELLANIKANLSDLTALRESLGKYDGDVDLIYRFWHQSFKVYWLQEYTEKIVEKLRLLSTVCMRRLSPLASGGQLDPIFEDIILDGTGKTWEHSHNQNWRKECQPIVDAYLHSRWFLDRIIEAAEMEEAPQLLPSGWAAVLELYGIR